MKDKSGISAVIITLNEQEDLPKCLKSLKDWVDEIVLVDSGSTDKTVEIARKFGAKVITRKFDNYSSQKNFASSKASKNWIIAVDADEEIPQKLASEIKNAIKNPDYNGYSIPRKNIIFGKFIRYTRWQPELDRHVWLWKKDKGVWQGDVHEELRVEGKVGRLVNAKIHYQYRTVKEFLGMIEQYSTIEARQRIKMGFKFSIVRLFVDPVYNFLVRFFYRLGFLDGWRGLLLSILMSYYHFRLWVKIYILSTKLSGKYKLN